MFCEKHNTVEGWSTVWSCFSDIYSAGQSRSSNGQLTETLSWLLPHRLNLGKQQDGACPKNETCSFSEGLPYKVYRIEWVSRTSSEDRIACASTDAHWFFDLKCSESHRRCTVCPTGARIGNRVSMRSEQMRTWCAVWMWIHGEIARKCILGASRPDTRNRRPPRWEDGGWNDKAGRRPSPPLAGAGRPQMGARAVCSWSPPLSGAQKAHTITEEKQSVGDSRSRAHTPTQRRRGNALNPRQEPAFQAQPPRGHTPSWRPGNAHNLQQVTARRSRSDIKRSQPH